MPYGVDKDQGGDNDSNTKFMENCVERVMDKNPSFSKGQAVAICKKSLKNKKDSSLSEEELIFDATLLFRDELRRNAERLVFEGRASTYLDAIRLLETFNYDVEKVLICTK